MDTVKIDGHKCVIEKEWDDYSDGSFYNYLVGKAVDRDGGEFYYASCFYKMSRPEYWMSGKYKNTFEYDHNPEKVEVERDMGDFIAEKVLNEHEAEFGADGRLAQERGL